MRGGCYTSMRACCCPRPCCCARARRSPDPRPPLMQPTTPPGQALVDPQSAAALHRQAATPSSAADIQPTQPHLARRSLMRKSSKCSSTVSQAGRPEPRGQGTVRERQWLRVGGRGVAMVGGGLQVAAAAQQTPRAGSCCTNWPMLAQPKLLETHGSQPKLRTFASPADNAPVAILHAHDPRAVGGRAVLHALGDGVQAAVLREDVRGLGGRGWCKCHCSKCGAILATRSVLRPRQTRPAAQATCPPTAPSAAQPSPDTNHTPARGRGGGR